MNLLFFSDVHGSPDSPAVTQCPIDRLHPHRLVFRGDQLYHGPRKPLRRNYAHKAVPPWGNSQASTVCMVRDNCDSEVDQMMIHFPILAEYFQFLTEKHQFFLIHGRHLNPDSHPQLPPRGILASEHNYISMLKKNDDGLIYFNPGSNFLPKGGNPSSFDFYDGDKLQMP